MAERAFAAIDRSKLASASRHFVDSLVGIALGLGVLALAAALSAGARPADVAPSSSVAAPLVVPLSPVAPVAASTALPAPLGAPAPVAAPAPLVAPAVASTTAAAASLAPVPVASVAPAAAAAKPAVALEAYRYGGKRYVGVRTEPGATLVAPRAGTVQVRVYQLVDGDVRVGSNVPWLPFFPYVTLATADGTLVYRPGALTDDATVLVRDGDVVPAGAPLFTVVGDGASSWRTFYDSGASFSVVVSLVAGGADLDPAPLIVVR